MQSYSNMLLAKTQESEIKTTLPQYVNNQEKQQDNMEDLYGKKRKQKDYKHRNKKQCQHQEEKTSIYEYLSRDFPRDFRKNTYALFLETYKNIPTRFNSLKPFILLKYIGHHYWDEFISAAAEASASCDRSDDYTLITSCFNNAYTTALVFFGEKRSQRVLKRLNYAAEVQLEIKLPSEKYWSFKVSNLFTGSIFCGVNKLVSIDEEVTKEHIDKCITPVVGSFQNYFNSLVKKYKTPDATDEEIIERIKKELCNLEYNFNANVFTSLQQDINSNMNKMSVNQSYIYWIVAVMPAGIYDHTFLIEQFMIENEVRYRIYQSWMMQATLFDDFKKWGYGINGENALTHKQLLIFLNKFTTYYTQIESSEKTIDSEDCFGYISEEVNPTQFNNEGISGLCVNYFCHAFNPQECLDNFTQFANTNSAMHSTQLKLK